MDQLYHSTLAQQPHFDTTSAYAALDREMRLPATSHLSYIDGAYPQVRFGHLFGYGATYYSYLLDRVIASKIWSHLFAHNPLDRQSGHLFKSHCLNFGAGKDPWLILAHLLGPDAHQLAHGGLSAMQQVGKWGIDQ